jgi:hypothetical protein
LAWESACGEVGELNAPAMGGNTILNQNRVATHGRHSVVCKHKPGPPTLEIIGHALQSNNRIDVLHAHACGDRDGDRGVVENRSHA